MVTVMVKSVAPFVLVLRPLGSKAKWTLPPLDVYNDYITFLDIYCLERLTDKKHEYLTTINWRSFWNGIGLIGLVTTDLTALGLVRAFIAQHSHDGLEFNTMPKDSNDRRSIVTVILKKDLRSFPAEKLAKVLILRNPGLAGHLTLASITHHKRKNPESATLKMAGVQSNSLAMLISFSPSNTFLMIICLLWDPWVFILKEESGRNCPSHVKKMLIPVLQNNPMLSMSPTPLTTIRNILHLLHVLPRASVLAPFKLGCMARRLLTRAAHH